MKNINVCVHVYAYSKYAHTHTHTAGFVFGSSKFSRYEEAKFLVFYPKNSEAIPKPVSSTILQKNERW